MLGFEHIQPFGFALFGFFGALLSQLLTEFLRFAIGFGFCALSHETDTLGIG